MIIIIINNNYVKIFISAINYIIIIIINNNYIKIFISAINFLYDNNNN